MCGTGVCGTEIAYGAMGCAVPGYGVVLYDAMECARMVLCGVLYWDSVWCYAVCGTELGYAATRGLFDSGSE
eukprot:3935582-Rhodomonas_salina.1